MSIFIVALIAAVPPTIASIVTLLIARRNTNRIHEVHLSMNSRFDEWMAMTKKSSFAEGHKAAEDERKSEDERKGS